MLYRCNGFDVNIGDNRNTDIYHKAEIHILLLCDEQRC